ncbi:MAG TPA: hypothetical protein VM557_09780 [Thermoanaerobaculia bacterium]|nr:hypothetical protein [Thermoanaerobaculia bacterium]
MRTIGEIFRRALDNVLANWPLLLIRVAEGIAILVVVIGALLLALMPLIAAGFGGMAMGEMPASGDLEQLMAGFPILAILGFIAVFSIAILVATIVHSFVQAGVIGCYAAADRRAPDGDPGRRSFQIFTPELWWSEAKRSGWRIFWIFNVLWGLYSVVLLLPLIPIAILLAAGPDTEAVLAIGCLGVALVLMVAFFLAIIVFLWSQMAIVVCVVRDRGIIESIKESVGTTMKALGPILAIVVTYFALSMAVGGALTGFAFGIDAAGVIPGMSFALLPLRVLISLIQSAITTAFGCWLIAALVATILPPRVAAVRR